MNQLFHELFTPEPSTWGLRGDPYLWADLAALLGETPVGSPADVQTLLQTSIAKLIGADLNEEGYIFVAKYAHGGLSSGSICCSFWRDTAIPLLVQRVQHTAPRTQD